MKHLTSAKELRNMQPAELERELRELRHTLSKQRLSIALGAEKDTGRYQRGKRHVARLLTVLHQKKTGAAAPLKKAKKSATVSAPVSK